MQVRNDFLDLRVPVWVRDMQFVPGSSKIVTCTGHHKVSSYSGAVFPLKPYDAKLAQHLEKLTQQILWGWTKQTLTTVCISWTDTCKCLYMLPSIITAFPLCFPSIDHRLGCSVSWWQKIASRNVPGVNACRSPKESSIQRQPLLPYEFSRSCVQNNLVSFIQWHESDWGQTYSNPNNCIWMQLNISCCRNWIQTNLILPNRVMFLVWMHVGHQGELNWSRVVCLLNLSWLSTKWFVISVSMT